MSISQKIKDARERKGLTDLQIAEKVGISIYEYGDVEAYDNEAQSVLDLKYLKKLCSALNINLFELFSFEKGDNVNNNYDLDRRDLIVSSYRNKLAISQDKLGDKVGFHGHVIYKMETDRDFLESWCLEDIVSLANVLDIPPWVLIGKIDDE